MDDEMTIDAILTSRPKGVDYAHLLEGMNHVPIIEDSKWSSSPFPPIINGAHTTVQSSTRRPVHRCDRMGQESMNHVWMLVALQAKERGGEVQTIHLTDCNGEEEVLPKLAPVHHRVPARLCFNHSRSRITRRGIRKCDDSMGGSYTGRSPPRVRKSARMNPCNMQVQAKICLAGHASLAI